MTATLPSWLPAFDDCESWMVVSRKQKKSSFFNYRKQSFCGEPRGSERTLFQVCCPGPGSISKESDSGPSFSFSGGIPGSFSESQLDIIYDPAVKRLDADLNVRYSGACSPVPACQRDTAFSCPLSRRQPGFEYVGEFQVDRVAGSGAPLARGPSGCVSVAVPGEHSRGVNDVTVAVPGEHSRRSNGAAAGSSTGTIGLLEGIESHDSKNLAHDGMMNDLVQGMEDVSSLPGVRRDHGRDCACDRR